MSDLPKGWLYTSLIDIVTLHDNKRIPLNQKQRLERKGSYPYYGANGQIDSVNDFIFDGNYILLAEDGGYFDDPSRRVAYEVSGKFWVNNHAHILSPCNQIFIKFLTYCLNTIHWMEYVTGTTRLKLTQEGMKRVIIPLPPLEEQKRIAEILDRSQFLISKRQEAIALLDSLTQAIFIEMFGDPVTNPKGIKIVHLSEITTRITDGVHQKPNYTEDGVPFISVKNITTGSLKFEDCKFISLNDHSKFTKRCKAERLDILYTKVGATYGRPALVNTDREFSLYVSVCLIKPNKEIVDPFFLNAALGTNAVKSQADRKIKGIGVPDLHLDQIQSFLIPLPSIEEQQKFAHRVEAVEKLKATHRASLTELQALFASLQHRAFRGEL